MIVRPANGAGFLYPSDADELVVDIAQRLLSLPPVKSNPVGLVVPHSSLEMCGDSCAAAFRHLAMLGPQISKVIILGSAGDGGAGVVLPFSEKFKTPLGEVEVNHKQIKSLSLLPFVHLNDRTHFKSLVIEAPLPFLQTCLVDFTILPILVGDLNEFDMRLFFNSLPISASTLVVLSVDVDAKLEKCPDPKEAFLFKHFNEFMANQKYAIESAELVGSPTQNEDGYKSYIVH